MLRWLSGILAAALVATLAAAQTAPDPASAPTFMKLKLTTRRIEVKPDGASVTTLHNELQLLQGAPLALASRQQIPYYDTVRDVRITGAYTLKSDGRKLAVPLDAITTEAVPRPVGTSSPKLLQKVIPFPDVETGDTLVYDLVSRSKPVIAGAFTYTEVISPNVARDDSRTTVVAPSNLPLYMDARGVEIVKTAGMNDTTYSVRYSLATPKLDLDQYVAEGDRERRFTLSSYKNYDELAVAYAALVAPKIEVTPGIRDAADLIRKNNADRREQARAAYQWVGAHITYLAEDFGSGWYIPHDAGRVLASAKGDCKDHAVLYMALLKTMGIDARMVLIDAQNGFTVASVPDFTQFNHVIVWLPEFNLYVDPTAHTAPFGVLPYSEYGKPVVHIGDPSGALHQTPNLDVSGATLVNATVETLDEQGRLTVTSSTTASGPIAIGLRDLVARMRARDPENYLAGGLMMQRLTRTSGTFTLPSDDDLGPQYKLSASYTTAPEMKFLSGDVIPRPENVTTIPPAEASFAGPIANSKWANADPVACYSGQATDDYTLQFPANTLLAALPQDATIRTSNLDYTSRWKLVGRTVSVHREYRARFDAPLCTGETRRSALEALNRIREDYRTPLRLKTVTP
jgi:transglutaminase-like putative cysteine protease